MQYQSEIVTLQQIKYEKAGHSKTSPFNCLMRLLAQKQEIMYFDVLHRLDGLHTGKRVACYDE